jgi:3-oxoacyl-(acyl-carrier-protein) synthase
MPRATIILGEGAASLCWRTERAAARGARIYAELAGDGTSQQLSYHRFHPSGDLPYPAMQALPTAE